MSLTLCDPTDCVPPGSSVHGILQARILGWVAMPFSRGSSLPQDETCVSNVSCIGRQVLYHLAPPRSQQSELGLEISYNVFHPPQNLMRLSLLWSVTVELLLCGCQRARSYASYQEKLTQLCTCLPGHWFPRALSTEIWFQTDSFWCTVLWVLTNTCSCVTITTVISYGYWYLSNNFITSKNSLMLLYSQCPWIVAKSPLSLEFSRQEY